MLLLKAVRTNVISLKHQLPIFTLRVPLQRLYIVNAPDLIQIIQAKTNVSTFISNLLDFGLLFSGVDKKSETLLRNRFADKGNTFTASIRKYLGQESALEVASRHALDQLSASISNSFLLSSRSEIPLLRTVQHDLLLAFTGAVYGPENPYSDPEIEKSWHEFVPGITHLLSSPFPWLTARKALRARARIQSAFARYFESGGHKQAFPMVPDMFERNIAAGLTIPEAAKMELATSLAMLSSGSITTFWLLFHIYSNPAALRACRAELEHLATPSSESDTNESSSSATISVVDASKIKSTCPVLMAHLQETLRLHSTLLSTKKVHHDTLLADTYLLRSSALVMIPAPSIHHDPGIWGPDATLFDHARFLAPDGRRKAKSTLAYRPFGAGVTMCPGRHFSTNVILACVAMVLLQCDVWPVEGVWRAPGKSGADMWNAMPKPDWDLGVRVAPRKGVGTAKWKFVWGEEGGTKGEKKSL